MIGDSSSSEVAMGCAFPAAGQVRSLICDLHRTQYIMAMLKAAKAI